MEPTDGKIPALKRLQVEMGELVFAFEDASFEMSHFLDLETGQVVSITDETRRELEEIYEEADDPSSQQPVDLAQVLQERDLHDWQREALLEADRVEAGYGTRYASVPHADSHEGYRDMEEFIATVQDGNLQDSLRQAIQGRGAFRRFKDVLAARPSQRERWFEFQEGQVLRRVLDWLESEGIEPISSTKKGMT